MFGQPYYFIFSFNRNVHEKMIRLQKNTFHCQSLLALIIYIPSLLCMTIVVNYYPSWAYATNVIMTNLTFNVASAVIIVMGLISFGLSFEPDWVKMVIRVSDYLTREKTASGDEVE